MKKIFFSLGREYYLHQVVGKTSQKLHIPVWWSLRDSEGSSTSSKADLVLFIKLSMTSAVFESLPLLLILLFAWLLFFCKIIVAFLASSSSFSRVPIILAISFLPSFNSLWVFWLDELEEGALFEVFDWTPEIKKMCSEEKFLFQYWTFPT